MAYARYGPDSKYYVFWQTSEASTKAQEVLAVWHEDHRSESKGTEFNYEQVGRMLETADFTPIPGYQPDDQAFLRPLLQEFMQDVDAEYRIQG
jgi:hypothetical protein